MAIPITVMVTIPTRMYGKNGSIAQSTILSMMTTATTVRSQERMPPSVGFLSENTVSLVVDFLDYGPGVERVFTRLESQLFYLLLGQPLRLLPLPHNFFVLAW